MFIISGQFEVKSQYRENLINMARDLVVLSQKETGCILYSFMEDQINQGHFLFFEKWQTREAIAKHFETPYFKNFADKFPAMIVGQANIEIHEVISTEKV